MNGEIYTCSACGAQLLAFDDESISFCSYCGSQELLHDRMYVHTNPDLIIPFKITKEEAIKAYRKKISNFIFAPGYLSSDVVVDRFRGIYMAYSVYEFYNDGSDGEVKCDGTKYLRRQGDYVYYAKYHITFNPDISIKGVSFDASSRFSDAFSQATHFKIKDSIPFSSNYLLGFYANMRDVDSEVYLEEARETAYDLLEEQERNLLAQKEFSLNGCDQITIPLKHRCQVGLFPIYFLSVRDKSGKRVHYGIVNGQTGEVVCDKPVDYKKFIFFTLALAFLLFLGLQFFLVLAPFYLLIFSIISGAISYFISKSLLRKIEKRRQEDNFKEILRMNKKEARNDKKRMIKSINNSLDHLTIHIVIPIIDLLIAIPFLMDAIYTTYNEMQGHVQSTIYTEVFFRRLFELQNTYIACILLGAGLCHLAYFAIARKVLDNSLREATGAKGLSFLQSFRLSYKELLAVIIPIAVFIINPVKDLYYYAAVVISLVLVVLSFLDLIREHNMLSSTLPPQLDKKEGK